MGTEGGNLATSLVHSASVRPRHIALLDGSTQTDYASLADAAGSIAAQLTAVGVAPGDRVGIFQRRGVSAAASFYGVLASGAVAVNINENLRPRQVRHIVDHASIRFLLTERAEIRRLGWTPPPGVRAIAPRANGRARLRPVPRTADDVAHIIYTSGSTGMPKGISVSHGNLWAGTRTVADYLGLRAEDRIASLLPLSFDYGSNQLLGSVLVGATLVVDRSPIPQRVRRTLGQAGVTVLAAVPPLWLSLLDDDAFEASQLPHLRIMTNTGGRMPRAAVRRLRNRFPDAALFLMYGLTEAFRSTRLPPDLVDRKPGSIGRAIPGAVIYVVDSEDRQVAPGEVGELVHRGPTVALGYWQDPIATSRRFRPLPPSLGPSEPGERVVYSGDLVRQDDDGDLYFVGRRDAMIKSSGHRVSPDEVADVLHDSGHITHAVVFGEEDERRGARIVAQVVLRRDGDLDSVWETVRSELPSYMQPHRIEVRRTLRRTSSGKYASGTPSTAG